MKVRDPHERLQSLWGLIDQRHNELLAGQLLGSRVLDVGCGYGSLVNYLIGRGFDAEGWDADPAAIERGRRLFPRARLAVRSLENPVGPPVAPYDAIVLKDALHHLVHEGDIDAAFARIRRLLRAGGRLVLSDPNPTWLLRAARAIVGHEDPEASSELALQLLARHGFTVRRLQFHETIGLALSGGYVGIRLVPNWLPLNRAVASVNQGLSDLVDRVGLGRGCCWRYLIAADLTGAGEQS